MTGPEIGDYRAESLVGQGSSAAVWAGRHRRTGQQVALKVFADADLHRALRQAEREAALAMLVDHPHLLPVLGVAADEEHVALVTMLAQGGALADLLEHRVLAPGEVRTLLAGMAGALAAAHELDLVHGDLSVANILLDADGRPLLADLGATRAAVEVSRPVVATPGSVAPEVARGAAPSAAADMFSLGAVALQALTGEPAWPADDLRDVVIQSTAGQWPDPGVLPPVDRGLGELIRRLLDPEPSARPTAVGLAMDLPATGVRMPIRWGTQEPEHHSRHLAGREPVEGAATGAARPSGSRAVDRLAALGPAHLDRLRSARAPAGSGRDGSGSSGAEDGVADANGGAGQSRERTGLETGSADPVREPARQRSLRRARALTRLRADAPPVPPTPVVPGNRALARIVTAALVVSVLGAGAVAAGLWWAGEEQQEPARLASVEAVPVRETPSARVGTEPGHIGVPGEESGDDDEAAGPAGKESGTAAGGSGSAGEHEVPVDDPAGDTTAEQDKPLSTEPPVTTDLAGVVTTDWAAVVRDLDAQRSSAFARSDPSALAQVYAPNAPPLIDDLALLADLEATGMTVGGAEHSISSVVPLDSSTPGLTVVKVTDSQPAQPVRDAAGEVVGHTRPRADAERLLVLQAVGDGYRIVSIEAL